VLHQLVFQSSSRLWILRYTTEISFPDQVRENCRVFDRALHEFVVLPDVIIETRPALRNDVALSIENMTTYTGLFPPL